MYAYGVFLLTVVVLFKCNLSVATLCPDGSICGQGTCCIFNGTNSYACCPWDNGVCCRDGLHCCPEGKTCDLVHNVCTGSSSPSAKIFLTSEVACGAEGTCPDGGTCCETDIGHKVCCPKDSKCGDSGCIKSEDLVEMKPSVVPCPDLNQCPDNTTCCMMQSGDYGCCPLPNAVCCPDKATCCPHGYVCVGGGSCELAATGEVTNEV